MDFYGKLMISNFIGINIEKYFWNYLNKDEWYYIYKFHFGLYQINFWITNNFITKINLINLFLIIF